MKRNWFSLSLYVEGLRQLRLMGILFTAAASLVALFIPIGQYISSLSTKGVTVSDVTCLQMNPLIIASFCIVAPFLVLNAFSFLNKRESSDFYHAIPAKRQCLFFSFFAAAITWLLIYMVVSTGLAVLGHAIFPKLFAINYTSVILTFFNCFAGGLLVAASVAIAMTVTGTLMTNILIALLIIFLPRILIYLFLQNIGYAFPLVDGLAFAPLLDTQYNVPAGYVLQYFLATDGDNVLTMWQSGLYTIVLAVIYTVIATVLFVRRKSEGAAQAAPSRRLQALFRFLVGFTVSSVVTLALFNDLRHSYVDLSDAFQWLFLYVIAVFVMLVFEILCTRRWKGLIRRGASTVGLLIVANLLLMGGIYGAERSLHSFVPSADEITSVRLSISGADYYGDNSDYFSNKTADVDLTDKTIRQIVSDQLKYSVELLDISENKYYDELYNNNEVIVFIKTGGFYRPRRIILKNEDIDRLSAALSKQSDYRNIYMDLPTNYSYISSNYIHLNAGIQAKGFYDILQAEVREIGFEKWYSIVNGSYPDSYFVDAKGEETYAVNDVLDYLRIRVSGNSGWYTLNIPLYSSVMPRTCAAYIDLYNNGNDSTSQKMLNALLTDIEEMDYLEAQLYNTDGSIQAGFWWDGKMLVGNRDAFVMMAQALKDYQPSKIDPRKPMIRLNTDMRLTRNDESGEYYEYASYTGFFAIPEGLIIPSDENQ